MMWKENRLLRHRHRWERWKVPSEAFCRLTFLRQIHEKREKFISRWNETPWEDQISRIMKKNRVFLLWRLIMPIVSGRFEHCKFAQEMYFHFFLLSCLIIYWWWSFPANFQLWRLEAQRVRQDVWSLNGNDFGSAPSELDRDLHEMETTRTMHFLTARGLISDNHWRPALKNVNLFQSWSRQKIQKLY